MENNQRMSLERRSTQRRSTQRRSTQRRSTQRELERKSRRKSRYSSDIDRYDRPGYDIHFIDNLLLNNKKYLRKINTSKNRVYKRVNSKIVEKNIEELTKLKNKKIKQLGYWDRIRYNFNRLPKKDKVNVLRQSNNTSRRYLLTTKPTVVVHMGL
jgi:hypothetical protein